MQKVEVPLQVANRTKKDISNKSSNFNLEPFELGGTVANIVGLL
jgi:hypothetical protein